jgi:hypothetical protein
MILVRANLCWEYSLYGLKGSLGSCSFVLLLFVKLCHGAAAKGGTTAAAG